MSEDGILDLEVTYLDDDGNEIVLEEDTSEAEEVPAPETPEVAETESLEKIETKEESTGK